MTTFDRWIALSIFVAVIATSSFPILYSLSPWYKTVLGRAMMAQSIVFAVAVDFTLLFMFYRPPYPWGRIITAIVFTHIAVTSTSLTLILWRLNYKRLTKECHESREAPVPDQPDV